MEKITKQQFIEMGLNPLIRKKGGAQFEIMAEIDRLEIAEALLIKKEEWYLKTPVNVYIPSSFRKKRSEKVFTTRRLLDKSGWAILRIN